MLIAISCMHASCGVLACHVSTMKKKFTYLFKIACIGSVLVTILHRYTAGTCNTTIVRLCLPITVGPVIEFR